MLSNIKSRYAAYWYVLVGADFHSEGGAWRSIHSFYKHLDQAGAPILLIDLRRKDGWRQWICSLLFAPFIVVNGMAAVTRWRVLAGLALRKNAAIYLHDTDYMIDRLQKEKPLVYCYLVRLLRQRTVLCVSERMATLYQKRFGALNTKVVFEVADLKPAPVLDSGQRHIVMAGLLNRRKGYPLFVRTAKLAAERGLPWKFHWVGGLGEADLAPVSDAIHWWGWSDNPLLIVKQADIFFLSSVDDPQPLACLEALALGKRAVVYQDTGSAEVVKGLEGCRVFAKHDAACALEALQAALGENVNVAAMQARLSTVADVKAFEQRIAEVFNKRGMHESIDR